MVTGTHKMRIQRSIVAELTTGLDELAEMFHM